MVRKSEHNLYLFVPKKKGLTEIKDYYPISLVRCLYKLLAKTLAIRLKDTLASVISVSQNAFIPRRHLSNCSLIANECIDAALKAGRSGVVCKIDMEKAYDHINWVFLDWILLKMGFGVK